MNPYRFGSSAVVFLSLLLNLVRLPQISSKRHRKPDFCKDLKVSEEDSFLWMVKRDPPSYFFGTIHVPYTRVWQYIPENTMKAFHMSDRVFFELDLTDPHTITSLTSCQLLPKGKSLSDVLPEELYSRLKEHLAYVRRQMPLWVTPDQKGRGLYADYLFSAITGNWQRKRPVWVMLMVNSLTESDIRSRGVAVLDLYLAQLAEKHSKGTGAVERVEEQCVPLNGLNFSQVLFALNHTLWQQEAFRSGQRQPAYTTDDLIEHYNCGDLDAVIFAQDTTQVPHLGNSSLPALVASEAERIDTYFREELIYRRNRRMGRRVVELFLKNPNESFFFAFGAGHFLGNFTVLDVLQGNGYAVEPISPYQKLRRHKRRRGSRGGLVPDATMVRDFTSNSLQAHEQLDPAFARFLSEHHKSSLVLEDRLYGMPVDLSSYERVRNSGTAPPAKKLPPFNDLWVRMDPRPTIPVDSAVLDESESKDAAVVEESLRVWFGLNGGGALISGHALLALLFCLARFQSWCTLWYLS